MSLHNWFSDDTPKNNEEEDFHKVLSKEIFKTIRHNIAMGNKGCFFELPIFRFGQAIGNVTRMMQVLQKKLTPEQIDIILIDEGPFVFINWQDVCESTIRNRQKYGETSEDALINKYRQMFRK